LKINNPYLSHKWDLLKRPKAPADEIKKNDRLETLPAVLEENQFD